MIRGFSFSLPVNFFVIQIQTCKFVQFRIWKDTHGPLHPENVKLPRPAFAIVHANDHRSQVLKLDNERIERKVKEKSTVINKGGASLCNGAPSKFLKFFINYIFFNNFLKYFLLNN